MTTLNTTKNLFEALRAESTIVVPHDASFRERCFGSLVRAARALAAWERSDRTTTVRLLDELFEYFVDRFEGQIELEDCRVAMTDEVGGKVSEIAFPILITKHILKTIRMDMSDVPHFARWVERHHGVMLAA